MRQKNPESLRTTILVCLGMLLISSWILMRGTVPAQKKNRVLRQQLESMLEERDQLECELSEVKSKRDALLSDPIAIQREALLQQGYTPDKHDVIVR